MKKLFTLIVSASLAFILCGCSPFSVFTFMGSSNYDPSYNTGDFTYKASEVSRICIDLASHKINIVGSDSNELKVRETINGPGSSSRIMWKIDNGTLYITNKKESAFKIFHLDLASKTLDVEIPSDIYLKISSASGSIDLKCPEIKTVTVDSASGSISAGSLSADNIQLNSVSGSIEAESLTCREKLVLSSVSGRISVSDLNSDNLKADTVSGSVKLGISQCAKLRISSVSGSINLRMDSDTGASVTFETVSGSLHADNYTVSGKQKVFGDGRSVWDIDTVSGSLTISR